MAEGGENPKDNPFSFKKFVKKKEKTPGQSDEDDRNDDIEDIFDLPDVRAEGRVENEEAQQKDDEKNKTKDDDNPFSFKKFLQSGASRPANTSSWPSGSANPGDIATLDLANDLPDFVQDHFNPSESSSRRKRNTSDVPLPDFALELDSSPKNLYEPPDDLPSPDHTSQQHPRLQGTSNSGGARPRPRRHPPTFGLDEDLINPHMNGHAANGVNYDNDPDDDDGGLVLPQPNATCGLPDFLSDSAVATCSRDCRANIDDSLAHNEDFPHHPNGDYNMELRRLRDENRDLRQQLEERRQFAETESRRVARVLQEMEAIQKRESEETAALENMVQQVEANLQATTQRAVAAENTISKLKQEIRTLQNQLQSLRAENTVLRGGDAAPNIVRDKAKYASEQLAAAANMAEQKLKDLTSGVETLRLVSNILASIDKFSEDGATGGDMDGATGGDQSPGGATGGAGPAT